MTDQEPTIVFEDDAFLCINKPPGLVVNRAQSVKEPTLQDWVEAHAFLVKEYETETEETKEFLSRSGIVHRLDKETSGLLLIAKTSESFQKLKIQFQERTIHKTYIAIVHGDVPLEGEIRAPVGRLPWNPEHFGILPGGKESVTHYKKRETGVLLMKHGKKDVISLVEVRPETGRTHQIRVHFKYIGYPLVGDYLYAGRKTARDDREVVGRVMLHAWKLQCTHPMTGKPLAFEAPIPDDMNSIISNAKV